jgi:lipoprotein-anchoring transpeptidase ErfK/SrfK
MLQSQISRVMEWTTIVTFVTGAIFTTTPARAEPLALVHPDRLHLQGFPNPPASEAQSSAELDADLRRQVIDYPTREEPGTIIVETTSTHLYLVLGGGKAIRYGIGVGREGFTWTGVRTIERKVEWPDWFPPTEMIARQPYLPRFVAGGPSNPLGARALYLSGSLYRIHGTNDPSTIGKHVSSGCIRMLNSDVSDLYARVNVGTKVIVQGGRLERSITQLNITNSREKLATAHEETKQQISQRRVVVNTHQLPAAPVGIAVVNDGRGRGLN